MKTLRYKTIVELVYKEGNFGLYFYDLCSYNTFGVKLVQGELILADLNKYSRMSNNGFIFHEILIY